MAGRRLFVVAALIFGFVMAGGAVPAVATPAAVEQVAPLGECTDMKVGEICGELSSESGSETVVFIVDNWPPVKGNIEFLSPGEESTKYFKDTDGFFIQAGCTGVISFARDFAGGEWHRIRDPFELLPDTSIRVDC